MTTLTLFIPESLKPIGNAIMRGLDFDVGGHLTFSKAQYTHTFSLDGVPEQVVPCCATNIPDSMPLAPNAAWWLADPTEIQAYLDADYAKRWPDETPPTLSEIQQFVDSVIAVNDESVSEVAARFNFTPAESVL